MRKRTLIWKRTLTLATTAVLGASVLTGTGVDASLIALADPDVEETEAEANPADDSENIKEEEQGDISQADFSIPEPVASVVSGFYTDAFELELSLPEGVSEGAKIYYTTDSSTPAVDNTNAKEYTEPISITKSQTQNAYARPRVIRAIVVLEDGKVSQTATFNYFCGDQMKEEQTLPVLSLVTDKSNLYDSETGLFKHPKESGKEWERPATFCYYTPDGTEQVNMDIGIRMHGGASRDFEMKSFRLYARKEYDEQNYFEYAFFEDSVLPAVESNSTAKAIDRFKHLILRNGGNEGSTWDATMFRDATIQSLVKDTHVDTQAYQPVVVFLNGEYYGLLNLRERYDKYYLASHYNCDKDDVAVYGFWYEGKDMRTYVSEGKDEDIEFLDDFYDFVRNKDLSDATNYEYVTERLDIESYIDYITVQVYSGNTDWPSNNVRAWRYTGEAQRAYGLDGKLRFMLYDTDFGLGLYGKSASTDFLDNALKVGSSEWPNCEDSTLLLRKLLENDTFKAQFVSRYMDLLNTSYSKVYVQNELNQNMKLISPYFDDLKSKYWRDELASSVSEASNFAGSRPGCALSELQKHCGALARYKMNIQIADVEGLDYISLNSIDHIDSESPYLDNGKLNTRYTLDVPVTLTAYAKEGYEFVGWKLSASEKEKGEIVSTESVFTYTEAEENAKYEVIPVFEEAKIEETTEAPENATTADDNASSTENGNQNGNLHKGFDVKTILLCIGSVGILGVLVGVLFISRKKK